MTEIEIKVTLATISTKLDALSDKVDTHTETLKTLGCPKGVEMNKEVYANMNSRTNTKIAVVTFIAIVIEVAVIYFKR